jgi:hypothetical protein
MAKLHFSCRTLYINLDVDTGGKFPYFILISAWLWHRERFNDKHIVKYAGTIARDDNYRLTNSRAPHQS